MANDDQGNIYKSPRGPANSQESIGWYLSLYWPQMQKEFRGYVQKYDDESKHHTVKWDNAPKGSDGVTEVDLTEGELTWLQPPRKEKTAKGAKASLPKTSKPKASSAAAGGSSNIESLGELEERFAGKTTKSVAFTVLKNSGPDGMSLQEIVEESTRLGLRDWSDCKQPKTTINVCVANDPAFVKIAPGRVGLRINGAVPRDDFTLAVRKEPSPMEEPKKRGRPAKAFSERVKKPRTEPQHWERKPPIDLSILVSKEDGSAVADAPLTVNYNVTIKQLKKQISSMTKGTLKPHFQKISYDDRPIDEDEEAFLVHTVRPAKVERKLQIALVISAE